MIGKTFGHYKIFSQLGSGGMGVVYEAEDTTLGRRVALKFLPEQYSQNPASLERFLREARSASALNHPNICTIYAAEQFDNTWVIAMELLEGSTLGQLIVDGTLNTDRILDIAIQVSDALDVAHAHGIVHRDIKPANIFVTRKSVVKVLDFGLAKLAVDRHAVAQTIGATAADPTSYLTSPGMAVGTAAYMSPEQARGEDLDGRSDLFSFGSVLYEMCTGRLPFEGTTSPVIFAGILERDPLPPEQVNPNISPKLSEIICKSLEKDRDLRYQTAAELRGDFKRLRRDTTGRAPTATPSTAATAAYPAAHPISAVTAASRVSQNTPVATGSPSSAQVLIGEAKRHKAGLIASIVVAVVVLAGLGYFGFKKLSQKPAGTPGQQMSIERLTNSGRVDGGTSISPDGKYVVYQMIEGGKSSLWLRQIVTSSSVKLLPDSDIGYGPTTFSPDGNFVYFTQQNSDAPDSLYVVPTLGGTPKKIFDNINGPIAFSPDGKQFAFVRELVKEGLSTIAIANTADGSVVKTVISSKVGEQWFGGSGLSWSADGKLIAVPLITNDSEGYHEGVGVVDMAGKLTPLIPKLSGQVGRMIWLNDGSGLVFPASLAIGSRNKQVFLVSYPDAQVRRITNDLNGYGTSSFGMTADDSTIVTIQNAITSNIFVSDLNGSNAKQLTQDQIAGTQGVAGGSGKIAYNSDASGTSSMWVTDENGGTPVLVSPPKDFTQTPTMSPDGKHVAYLCLHDNKLNIWVADTDGNNIRALTSSNADLNPIFGDNDTVYYQHIDNGRIQYNRISLSGGEPTKVSSLHLVYLRPSHKGDRLFVDYFDDAVSKARIGIMSKEGKILNTFEMPVTSSNPIWSPDDTAILYTNTVNNITNIWKMDLNGQHPQQLTHYDKDMIFSYWVLPNGKLLMAQGHVHSDAILIRNFR
ncbi:serine/threonine protein kinase [Candidatus Koribacter versatilis Ellin345]|uniref:non-specific serine/threonine protein kinase n=1 Tax=Koribacter versatilis (strain Ellin345) TaxID=204669 RepID=Q1IN33_KORVE|nr:protein kinase [Candidatus Koribacter versatilis]ABF41717.1 serine/threonine protein kinase [Candidatus Koribacter versatilis Ellin345]